MEFEHFYLVACYTPNAGEGLKRVDYRTKEWDADFFAHLRKLEETKPVVLGGDLNVAHKEMDIYDTKNKHKVPGFSPQERKSFDDFLGDSGFVDTFRHLYPDQVKYSFWSVRANLRPVNKGWRLDYWLASKKAMPFVQDSLIHNE